MKTIVKNEVYDRVDNQTADLKVKSQGWKFTSKSNWKTNVRDIEKTDKPKKEKKVNKK